MTTALALIGMLFLGLFLGVLVMSIRAAAGRRDADEREARWRHCCRWLTEHIAKLEALQRAEQPRPEQCGGIQSWDRRLWCRRGANGRAGGGGVMAEWLTEQLRLFDEWHDTVWGRDRRGSSREFIDWLERTGRLPWRPISDMPPEGASVLMLDAKTPWADVDWDFRKEGLDPSITHWQLVELPKEQGDD